MKLKLHDQSAAEEKNIEIIDHQSYRGFHFGGEVKLNDENDDKWTITTHNQVTQDFIRGV